MKKILKAIWLLNPIRELFRIIGEIDKRANTGLVSIRGLEVMNTPELREEAELQIRKWKESGGSGICVINLHKKIYEKKFLIEKLQKP